MATIQISNHHVVMSTPNKKFSGVLATLRPSVVAIAFIFSELEADELARPLR